MSYRATFSSTPGSYRGGAYLAEGAALFTSADSCAFDSNLAGAVGGAVAVDGGTFSSSECSFSDNVAENGGAISASSSDDDDETPSMVYLRGGSLLRNVARELYTFGYYGYGGALRAEKGSEATLYLVTVEDNKGAFGGGISLSAESRASCSEVNFSSNAAGVAGGAVQAWGNGSHILLEKCRFVDNVADDYVHSTTSSSTSSEFPTLDEAGAAGGAISATDGGSVVLLDSTLSSNGAGGRGGGVHCGDLANVIARRVDFDGHLSGMGGDAEAHGGAIAAVRGCMVSSRRGGGAEGM